MRKLFHSYYRPTKEEFAKMWQEAAFAFDTNVLLNIYRYTPETRERLFEILKRLQDRIWLPYQSALEYHERRLGVISTQLTAYEAIETQLDNSLKATDNELRKYKRHAYADIGQITEIINDAVEKAKAILQEARSKHPDLLVEDNLLDTITDLFNGKVGEPYIQQNLEQVLQDAEQRVKQKIPPGYKDTNKDGPKQYGDVLIWFQLIDYAKAQKKPLIFVTDDGKEDWWLRHEGKTIGPRRELIQEMFDEAGVTFYMYSTDQFMAHAEKLLDIKDQQGSQAAIEEVKEIRLEAQSLALEAQADAVATSKQSFNGRGSDIRIVNLKSGVAVFRLKYEGNDIPAFYLRDEDDRVVSRLNATSISILTIPKTGIQKVVKIKSDGAYLLKVKASGSWEVEIEQERKAQEHALLNEQREGLIRSERRTVRPSYEAIFDEYRAMQQYEEENKYGS